MAAKTRKPKEPTFLGANFFALIELSPRLYRNAVCPNATDEEYAQICNDYDKRQAQLIQDTQST